MFFKNEKGEEMRLADNLTLQELHDMGVEIVLVEKDDQQHHIWMDEEEE